MLTSIVCFMLVLRFMVVYSKENVVVAGGTGFIGSHLVEFLTSKGHDVTILSRNPCLNCMTWQQLLKKGLSSDTTVVINLAGQNILDPWRVWTDEFKAEVYRSRVNTTKLLANSIKNSLQDCVFITMSGVGIYPTNTSEIYTEYSKVAPYDFLSELCHDWEKASKLPKKCRVVNLRTGAVLGKDGGIIRELYGFFKYGLGGKIGSGEQYMPWIHIDDLVRLIDFSIANRNVSGVLNAVAPEVITNEQFSQMFASELHQPVWMRIPSMALNLFLGSERAKILTEGQIVHPVRTQSFGFNFSYPTMHSALNNILKSA